MVLENLRGSQPRWCWSDVWILNLSPPPPPPTHLSGNTFQRKLNVEAFICCLFSLLQPKPQDKRWGWTQRLANQKFCFQTQLPLLHNNKTQGPHQCWHCTCQPLVRVTQVTCRTFLSGMNSKQSGTQQFSPSCCPDTIHFSVAFLFSGLTCWLCVCVSCTL